MIPKSQGVGGHFEVISPSEPSSLQPKSGIAATTHCPPGRRGESPGANAHAPVFGQKHTAVPAPPVRVGVTKSLN